MCTGGRASTDHPAKRVRAQLQVPAPAAVPDISMTSGRDHDLSQPYLPQGPNNVSSGVCSG